MTFPVRYMSRQLFLRRPEVNDASALFRIFGDPATNKFNPAGPLADETAARQLLDNLLSHWDKYGLGPWTVSRKSNVDEIIGFGGVSYKQYGNTERINLGFRFAPSSWGNGFASELTQAALTFAFMQKQIPEVFGLTRPQNLPSRSILEKNGMKKCGTLNDVPGEPESVIYVITRQTWEEKNLCVN